MVKVYFISIGNICSLKAIITERDLDNAGREWKPVLGVYCFGYLGIL